jgi:lipopolysaccharide/colanic/teichoic acid biosynthesis glycosyltransferase
MIANSPVTGNRYRQWAFLARNRYQLAGATLFAIVLPAAIRAGLSFNTNIGGSLQNTVIGTFAAMLVGAYLLRRATAYPGVSTRSALVPAFVASFGIAVLVFFFVRIDYSRFLFLASFILTLAWFSFVGMIEPHVRRQRLYLLPFGRADHLLASTGADWVVADSSEAVPRGMTGVVADLDNELAPEWERLLARAALSGLPVYHWKQVAESLTGMVEIEHLSENTFGSLLPSSIYLRFKRLVDVTAALVILPLAIVIAIPVILAILIEDGRPVLFRQRRMGFRGRPFVMLKFRTMRVANSGPAFTQANDPRITRVGRVIRRCRIDELPQIINILAGDMSWIGPRPEAIELAEWYESQIPFYEYRHIVRPGITGWAQVNQGNVAEIKAATGKLRYDFYYIKYFSAWLDLLIAAKTVRTILTGFGAR